MENSWSEVDWSSLAFSSQKKGFSIAFLVSEVQQGNDLVPNYDLKRGMSWNISKTEPWWSRISAVG